MQRMKAYKYMCCHCSPVAAATATAASSSNFIFLLNYCDNEVFFIETNSTHLSAECVCTVLVCMRYAIEKHFQQSVNCLTF